LSAVAELAAGDLEEFLSDIALTQLVVFKRQMLDQGVGVIRRTSHGHHPGALFARLCFQQNPVHDYVEVNPNEITEDRLGAGFKDDLGCVGRQFGF